MTSAVPSAKIVGVDIGGANLKVADAEGRTRATPFPMWTQHAHLGDRLRELVLDLLGCVHEVELHLAVTMTGELADCFFTRREGVARILQQVQVAFPNAAVSVYTVHGEWWSVSQAVEQPWSVAASNWHALAKWCLEGQSHLVDDLTLIVDIGSTTADIIPIRDRAIATTALTDRQRMERGQLVYTGVERTPVHAIVHGVHVESRYCPVMAERFATIHDAYVVVGEVDEEPDNTDSADNRLRTRQFALGRIARMVGEDTETLSEHAIERIAVQIIDAQVGQVAAAIADNLDPTAETQAVLATGHGTPLLRRVAQRPEFDRVEFYYLGELISDAPFSNEMARSAPAVAVAWLLEKSVLRNAPPLDR